MPSKLLVPASFSLFLLALGCGSDCQSLCEDEKACPNSDRTSVGCEAFCDALETRAEETGCQDELDALVDCQSDRDDICSDVGCDAEAKAYDSCAVRFCEENPDDPGC